MEIHVNGEPVAKVNGFSRGVSIHVDGGGEISSFSVAPGTRILNLVVEQTVPANAPRLDELEFIQYLKAYEDGKLSGDGSPVGGGVVERITSSDVDDGEKGDGETAEEQNENEKNENENEENKSPFTVGALS